MKIATYVEIGPLLYYHRGSVYISPLAIHIHLANEVAFG